MLGREWLLGGRNTGCRSPHFTGFFYWVFRPTGNFLGFPRNLLASRRGIHSSPSKTLTDVSVLTSGALGIASFEKGYGYESESGRRRGDEQEAHAQGTRVGPFGRTRNGSAETKQGVG